MRVEDLPNLPAFADPGPIEVWGDGCPCCGSWLATYWFGDWNYLCRACGHEWSEKPNLRPEYPPGDE